MWWMNVNKEMGVNAVLSHSFYVSFSIFLESRHRYKERSDPGFIRKIKKKKGNCESLFSFIYFSYPGLLSEK